MDDIPLDEATQGRIRALAAEYVELVDVMRAGQFDGNEEYQALSSQRGLAHDERIALTCLVERPTMYGYCGALLAA